MIESPIRVPAGSIVGNPGYRRGVRLVEDREGNIILTYIENSDSPFRSPVVTNNAFDTWSQALNYLTIWSILPHIQWW
jgi:hypothetical protein